VPLGRAVGDPSNKAASFAPAALTPDLFLTPNNVVRMGLPPVRMKYSPPFPESSSMGVTPKR